MKKIQIRRKLTGYIVHVRRNMWGNIVRPGSAYSRFKDLKSNGWCHPDYTWKMCCEAYRKKIRKMKIAKESRRRNRR